MTFFRVHLENGAKKELFIGNSKCLFSALPNSKFSFIYFVDVNIEIEFCVYDAPFQGVQLLFGLYWTLTVNLCCEDAEHAAIWKFVYIYILKIRIFSPVGYDHSFVSCRRNKGIVGANVFGILYTMPHWYAQHSKFYYMLRWEKWINYRHKEGEEEFARTVRTHLHFAWSVCWEIETNTCMINGTVRKAKCNIDTTTHFSRWHQRIWQNTATNRNNKKDNFTVYIR